MIQAWCPHHGLYPITLAVAREYSRSLLAGAQCMKETGRIEKLTCNEEVFIFINGKRMAHPDEITEYLKGRLV